MGVVDPSAEFNEIHVSGRTVTVDLGTVAAVRNLLSKKRATRNAREISRKAHQKEGRLWAASNVQRAENASSYRRDAVLLRPAKAQIAEAGEA